MAYLARLRVRDIPVALHARRPAAAAAAEGVLDAANLRPSKRRGCGCFIAKGVYVPRLHPPLLLHLVSIFGTYDYEPGHRRDRESGIF